MNDQNEDVFSNPMIDHYVNPDLNAFNQEGITIETVKQNSRLFLTLTQGLKKNAIHNIMKQFGDVVNIHIPASLRSDSRMTAFVEYATFKEAEKALRELNSSKNGGLKIRAEFAHEKCSKTDLIKSEKNTKGPENYEAVEEEIQQIKIDPIDLNRFKSDDIFEKVSNFNYKIPYVADLMDDQQKYLKSYAENAKGVYNEEEDTFEFNMQLKASFLTFNCRVCAEEASLLCETSRKYFCSIECADIYFKNNNGINQMDTNPVNHVEKYQAQKSDKVCLTAIINEKCIFVRPSDEDLNFLLEAVYRKSKDCQPVDVIPEIHDKVLVKYFDSVYRAEILEIFDEDETDIFVMVRLTDVGNTICVEINNICEMTPECMKIKEMTTKLMLKDVNVEAINLDVIKYLTDLMDKKIELLIVDIDENGDAELINERTNEVINEKIIKLANFNEVKFDDYEDLSFINDCVPYGEKQKLFVVNATCMESLGGICCVNEKYVKDFHEFYRSLNAYGQKIDPDTYGIGGINPLSLVKYNNQWHRAVVNAIGNGNPECVLIDLQCKCNVEIENIFKIPKVFAMQPLVTDIYKIKGYDTNEEIKKYCDENISSNHFIVVDKVEIEDNFPLIHFSPTNN